MFYWTAFVLCWALLPFMMSYVNCGEFTLQGKMKRALKEQVRYYTIIGSLGICVVIYLWWTNAFERYGANCMLRCFYRLSFRGFLIAMSNSWGLFQIIIFLGYGVVAMPKDLYKGGDLKAQHDNAMYKVMVCEEHL